jgi:hypothetical protein
MDVLCILLVFMPYCLSPVYTLDLCSGPCIMMFLFMRRAAPCNNQRFQQIPLALPLFIPRSLVELLFLCKSQG